VKLAYCGREKLFGIFDSLSETNLRVYNPFWVALRNIVSGINELAKNYQQYSKFDTEAIFKIN